MNKLNRILAGLSLITLAACGGGGGGGSTVVTPPAKTYADTLNYTNPASGDFKLVKNTSLSTATHLVLDLMGPTSGSGRGVAFTLTAESTKVTWAKVAGADATLVENVGFSLGTGTQILSAKSTGGTLQAGLFQKGTAAPAITLNTTLARVALDLKLSAVPVGSSVAVTFSKGNYLPETGAPVTLSSIGIGTLQAQ